MTLDNQLYFLRREQECRAQAAAAADPSIGRLHLDFADRYRRAARGQVKQREQ